MLEVGDTWITLTEVRSARPTAEAAADFGRALAATHAAGAPAFGAAPAGWPGDAWIGRQGLSMRPTAAWGRFYAEHRLMPYAIAARQRDNLTARGLRTIERVCARLVAGEFDDGRPPERIHGDLWAGNVIFSPAGVVLIDPAAHGGHGLTDLAMLNLFGAPQLATIQAAYVEAANLDTGWTELIGLHQLHPLLVHAVSHGAAYGQSAESVADRYT